MVAGVYGTAAPEAVARCGGVPATPVRGFFGFNNSWIWIILLLIFVLPRLGLGGCGGIGGLFGGQWWVWIALLFLVIFLVPGILPGFRLGGFAI
jgi:hypothetical protein